MKNIIFIFAVFLLASCSKKTETEDILPVLQDKSNNALEFFGFTLVDVYFDDPTDSEVKISYLDEVAPFSNLADILIVEPTQDVKSNLQAFKDQDVQAILHLHFLFFEVIGGTDEKSGVVYGLRSDYEERWATFVQTNDLVLFNENIGALYIGEEPAWNSITAEDLELATNLLDSYSDDIPIMIIEASLAIDDLVIPEKADWVGFDHYFLKDPSTNAAFLSELEAIRQAKYDNQDIILIMDSHYIKTVHSIFDIEKTDMDDIAAIYYEMANDADDIIGILGYHWPSGFESASSIGARHLTDNAKSIYTDMGKKITGK